MKKKIILLFLCFILLSGCTIRSNVTINYDGTVEEDVKILDNTSNIKTSNINVQTLIESVINENKAVLDFRKYNYKIIEESDYSGASINKSYNNICSYFQDTAFNQYVFKHIKCTEEKTYFEIQNDTDYIPYCADCSNWPALDDAKLVITLPVSAEKNNADTVNGNTYTWVFDKNTNVNKSFYLKINKEKVRINEAKVKKELESKKKTDLARLIGTILGVVVSLIILLYILYKKHIKNRLEY